MLSCYVICVVDVLTEVDQSIVIMEVCQTHNGGIGHQHSITSMELKDVDA